MPTPALRKVDSIMYKVKDLAISEAFYTDVMGMTKVWEDADQGMMGFLLKDSDSEIVLHTRDDLPPFSYNYLVDNVKQFCDEHRRKDYKIAFGPIKVRSGSYAVLVDPDGNRIPIIDLTEFGGVPRYDR